MHPESAGTAQTARCNNALASVFHETRYNLKKHLGRSVQVWTGMGTAQKQQRIYELSRALPTGWGTFTGIGQCHRQNSYLDYTTIQEPVKIEQNSRMGQEMKRKSPIRGARYFLTVSDT